MLWLIIFSNDDWSHLSHASCFSLVWLYQFLHYHFLCQFLYLPVYFICFHPFEFGWVLRLLWPTIYGISNAVPVVGMALKCAKSQPLCCEKPKPYAEAMLRCSHWQLGYEGTALEAYAALVDIWLQCVRDLEWLVPWVTRVTWWLEWLGVSSQNHKR